MQPVFLVWCSEYKMAHTYHMDDACVLLSNCNLFLLICNDFLFGELIVTLIDVSFLARARL
jgi:hypothetical protein